MKNNLKHTENDILRYIPKKNSYYIMQLMNQSVWSYSKTNIGTVKAHTWKGMKINFQMFLYVIRCQHALNSYSTM